MKRQLFLVLLPIFLVVSTAVGSPAVPNFSGTWKLSGERSTPMRTGNATLHIDHRNPELTVETTLFHGSGESGHATQRYTTDGNVSVSTGADGDEFHTSILWDGTSLVFSIEEHEDGRIIASKETWTLIENENTLQRVREKASPLDGSGKQTLIYLRAVPQM